MKTLINELPIEQVAEFACTHTSNYITPLMKAHLNRLKSQVDIFGELLITRACTSPMVGICAGRLAIKACQGDFDLPVIKNGRSVRYKLSDIVKFLERNTLSSTIAA